MTSSPYYWDCILSNMNGHRWWEFKTINDTKFNMSDVGICVHAVSHSISRYRNFVALKPFIRIWPKRIHYIHFNFINSKTWVFVQMFAEMWKSALYRQCIIQAQGLARIGPESIRLVESYILEASIWKPVKIIIVGS